MRSVETLDLSVNSMKKRYWRLIELESWFCPRFDAMVWPINKSEIMVVGGKDGFEEYTCDA